MNTKQFDIVIVGAGPGGCACALALRHSGLKIALIDKATFPRDKVCGDAIPGPSFKTIHALEKAFGKKMDTFKKAENIVASKIFSINHQSFTINWFTKSYNSKRIDFDHFLLNLVKQNTDAEIHQGITVKQIFRDDSNLKVVGISKNKTAQQFLAKMVIGADGANSIIAKKLLHFRLNKNHHCAAVRAYYKGISGLTPNTNEFHLIKKYVPGYFWIFPLPNGYANVGFGMQTQKISDKQLDLKKSFNDIVSNHPNLKYRFQNATLESTVKGFGLPLGSRFFELSGERFMLVGDAGSLVDPLQGHGIDKAMISGKYAAEQAISCFQKNRFDAKFMKTYDERLYSKLGKEFKRNYLFLKLFSKFPQSLNLLVWFAQNRYIKYLIQRFT